MSLLSGRKPTVFTAQEMAELDKYCEELGIEVAKPDDPIYSQGSSAIFLNRTSRTTAPKAQTAAEFSNRGNAKRRQGDLTGAIADCTRAIKLDPKLADAYYNRGVAKGVKGKFAGALADYSRVLEINPQDAGAYNMRGYTRQAVGDIQGAIADYNRALQIDPKLASAYRDRGVACYLKRDWPRALDDFRSACKFGPHEDYPQLFAWLVRARLNQQKAASKALAAYLENCFDTERWPSKIASFLLGKLPEPDFLAAADSPDPQQQGGQRCEALFYAGMKCLIANDRKAAVGYFKKCLATKQKGFAEYQCAESELEFLT